MTTPTDQELEKVARETGEKVVAECMGKWFTSEGWKQKVASLILSALKQVQPTKPLVDSIAASPQEQQPAVPNIKAEVLMDEAREVARSNQRDALLRMGSIDSWAKKIAALVARYADLSLESTPANPPKEGRASAESETNWGDAIDKLGFIGSGSCVPNIDTQRLDFLQSHTHELEPSKSKWGNGLVRYEIEDIWTNPGLTLREAIDKAMASNNPLAEEEK